MSKTTSYAMYPHSVIGFGFAIDGFKLLPTWKQRRSKQSFVCIHHVASLCQMHEVSAQVGFSQPGKLERLFIKCCSLLWTDRASHQMLLHASLIRIKNNTSLSTNLAAT